MLHRSARGADRELRWFMRPDDRHCCLHDTPVTPAPPPPPPGTIVVPVRGQAQRQAQSRRKRVSCLTEREWRGLRLPPEPTDKPDPGAPTPLARAPPNVMRQPHFCFCLSYWDSPGQWMAWDEVLMHRRALSIDRPLPSLNR